MYKSVNKEYIKIIRICVHAQCEQKQNKDITEKKNNCFNLPSVRVNVVF